MKPWIALLLILFALPAIASDDRQAASHKLSYFGLEQNLSETTVTSIQEDHIGFVWVGTINGLNRFDGKSFKQYNSSNADLYGLGHNTIRQLHVDEAHRLWVVTNQQLYRYDLVKDRFDGVPLDHTSNLWSVTSEGNHLFVGTETGLLKYDIESQSTLEVKSERFSYTGIAEVFGLGNGLLLFSESKGSSFAYDVHSEQTIELNLNGHINSVSKIHGSLYVLGTSVGLIILDTEQFRLERIYQLPIDYAQFNPESQTLYFTSGKSLFVARTDELQQQLPPTLISARFETNPSSLYLDTLGNLWLGIIGTGAVKLSFGSSNISQHDIQCTNANCNQVWSLAQFDGDIWVANDSEYVITLNQNDSPRRKLETGILGPKTIHSHEGTLLTGGKGLLHLATVESGAVVESAISLDDKIVTSITSLGERVLLGTFSHGVLLLDNNQEVDSAYFSPQVSSTVFTIEVSDHFILVGSQTGVHIYEMDDRLGIWIRRKNAFPEKIITSISPISDGYLIGTVGEGFYKLSADWSESKQSFGIPDEEKILVYSSVEQNGSVYASFSNGIVEIDQKSLSVLNFYDQSRGAQKEFNGMASLATNDAVYFGGTQGVNRLTGTQEHLGIRVSSPIFTSLKVFNKEESVGQRLRQNIVTASQIELKYSDYPFSLSFASLINDYGSLTSYRYRVVGLDDKWIELDNSLNFITFTNLSYGEYTLELESFIPFLSESQRKSRIRIIITPPWWLSTYAKTTYWLIALLIFYMAHREFLRRKRVQLRIAQSEERLKLSLWGSGDEMWDWDMEAGKIYRSNIWGTLEFPRDGKRSGKGESNIHPDDLERVNDLLLEHFKGESEHFEATYRVKSKTGHWLWILDRAKVVERDEQDRPTRMTGTIKDISSIKEAEERLTLFARALKNISEGMFILDDRMHYIEVNEACLELTGFPNDNFIDQPMKFERYPEAYTDDIIRIVRQQGRWSGELELERSNGRVIQIELTLDQIRDNDTQASFYVGVFSDITHRKQAESELRRLTNNDVLTGLPNRSYLQISLDNLVRRQVPLCLLIFDLDNFKKVNDSLGHGAGDALLCHVANRVKNQLPKDTSLYRLGGDEFAVVYDGANALNQSTKLAQEILAAFSKPFLLDEGEVVVNTSIGIVTYPEDDIERQALLRKADLAMYHAKGQGGQCYQFFSESLNQAAMERLDTENLIRQALKENHFEVYYQPKVDLKTNRIHGMEALVRLNHPVRGLIRPGEFIPLAEETGLVVEIGEYVLKQACFAAEKWRSMGALNGRIAVNLASQQFMLPDLCERIQRILELTRLPAHCLELEITEGTVIQQPDKAIATMQSLQDMGIHLALDDFGTGYSSLSYLKRFPIDTLKVDKSFVDDIATSNKDRMMTASIVTIARNMELSVVAEGVETQEQLAVLKGLQCDLVQGYFFSKPIPEVEFEKMLLKSPSLEFSASQETVE
ncbi:EAL domain-containing protein [Ferrimonas balearica]|uniref:EAL domain-containing protein n=1 Tax=Ferrimonas balearica TaxID=44012 RepID=UPI001C9991E2|nr:EAL domain-containing protein [Ferrimonas balearica]MBY5993752.1 EAL domain-containing protein [Ferrimonas balearica]